MAGMTQNPSHHLSRSLVRRFRRRMGLFFCTLLGGATLRYEMPPLDGR
jgi:hypothetical protein